MKFGRQMLGPHINMRSDISTCELLAAIKINVKFPDPLKRLWSELPAIDDTPFYTERESGVALPKAVLEYAIVLKCATPKTVANSTSYYF